jgi:hypothetical protein
MHTLHVSRNNMKLIRLLIGILPVTAFSAPSLSWTFDFNEIPGIENYTIDSPYITTFSDKTTFVTIPKSDYPGWLLFLLDSDGERIYTAPLDFQPMLTNFANDANVFVVSEGGGLTRFYERSGETYSFTAIEALNIYPGGDGSATEREIYTMNGAGLLSKYEFLSATPKLVPTTSGSENSNYIISWESEVGAGYQIQESTDLEVWTPLSLPIQGTGASLSWSTPITTNSAFYRIVLQ